MKAGWIEWECPSNIALIKYWGKKPGQFPINPSLSITLSESVTRVRLEYEYDPNKSGFHLDFLFNGKPDPAFSKKVAGYLTAVSLRMPVLEGVRLKVSSENNFPHSAGIASSASAFGAIALALCSMEEEILQKNTDKESFFKKASFFARLGSGSACRSVYGGYVIWGSYLGIKGSSDETAVRINEIPNDFRNLKDSILIVSSAEKQISSSAGHNLMNNNPFALARINQAGMNLSKILEAIHSGNMFDFIDIMEYEALTLHSMMMTSVPGYILMKPGTLEIIHKIRNFRSQTGYRVGFTLDAGPNIHFIYPIALESEALKFIESSLISHCENGMVIHDKIGDGPKRIH